LAHPPTVSIFLALAYRRNNDDSKAKRLHLQPFSLRVILWVLLIRFQCGNQLFQRDNFIVLLCQQFVLVLDD